MKTITKENATKEDYETIQKMKNLNGMKMEIEKMIDYNSGFQQIHRLKFIKKRDNKVVEYVDLWDGELEDLRKLLNESLSFKDVNGNYCY